MTDKLEYTINQLLSMKTQLRERKNDLKPLVGQSSTVEEVWKGGDKNDITTKKCKYDVVDVDQKIVEIDMALYAIDSAIKQANAVTKVTIDTESVNFAKLMSPLKAASVV
jgi:hypothetical protein